MSEEQFSDLFQDSLAKTGAARQQERKPGDRIQTRVVGVSGGRVFLDIAAKNEGVIDAAELRDEAGNLTVAEGATVTAYFVGQRGGEILFTTRPGAGSARCQELEEAYATGNPIEGRVTGEVKGGFSVTVAGQRGFCPYSQMDIRRVNDPSVYLENRYLFKVMEYGSNGRNIILSARAVLEEERSRLREELQQRLKVGDQVQGAVSSLRDFGAFVDIGGVDGLIPLSELVWGHVERADEVLSLGQQVSVIIKGLDWEKERISLSLKDTTENPWTKVAEKFPQGSVHTGTISRLAAFGAFVTLAPGIDGLLHISKLGAGRRINHPREVVSEGQEIAVRIDGLDLVNSRISLVPEDYTEKSDKQADRGKQRDSRNRESTPRPEPFTPAPPQSLGTLADLLTRQMQKKKRE